MAGSRPVKQAGYFLEVTLVFTFAMSCYVRDVLCTFLGCCVIFSSGLATTGGHTKQGHIHYLLDGCHDRSGRLGYIHVIKHVTNTI